ncbi:hypothetical protein Misp01_09670 [Microtetraspora sp. NBRC 13810]|uniref:hypothetical protein n=1 Tax=Microtetraspora sp. NBRC 13810 TaxID=3030990 RepID=UPI0024A1FD9C|nr:hypothetical protein [Microtetraspora sp. NBRC 13810]GLW05837.1 hypothetical protein Misp01_09670 [Microtetraspora sp. NBRC 13810]
MPHKRVPRVRAPLEVRLSRATIAAFAVFLMGRTFAHYLQEGVAHRVAALVLAAAVVVLYVLAACTTPDPRRRRWLLGTMALLVYLPLPLLGEWWAASGVLLAAAVLGLLPRPRSLLAFVAVVLAEAVKAALLGDDLAEVLSWTLTVAVAAVLLAGLTHFAETARVLYATRANLASAMVSAERARATRKLEAVLGSRLDAIAAQGRRVLTGTDDETVRNELNHLLDMAREAQRETRGFAHREQQSPSKATNHTK